MFRRTFAAVQVLFAAQTLRDRSDIIENGPDRKGAVRLRAGQCPRVSVATCQTKKGTAKSCTLS